MFGLFLRTAQVHVQPAETLPPRSKAYEVAKTEPVLTPVLTPVSSVVTNSGPTTLYSGVKTFWRARLTMEIMIIDYQQQDCLEVVSYAAKCDSEGSRIYVSRSGVLAKLTSEDVEKLAQEEKENRLRAKKSFHWDQLIEETQGQLMIRFILSRLSLHTAEEGKLEMYLSQSYSDQVDPVTGKLDVVCEKPEGLVAYCLKPHKVATLDEIQQALNDVDEGTKDVGNSFASVHRFVTSARSALGLKKSRNNSISFLSRYSRNSISRRGFVANQDKSILSILQKVRVIVKLPKKSRVVFNNNLSDPPTLKRENTLRSITSSSDLTPPNSARGQLFKRKPSFKRHPSKKSFKMQKSARFPAKEKIVDVEKMALSFTLTRQNSKPNVYKTSQL